MMRQMRENTKWVMLITVLAFAGLMVFEWGMDASGRSSAGMAGGEIGRVNREPITWEQYQAVYRTIYQQQQQAINGPITTALNRQIEEAAWEQVVMQRLIEQELRRRGITVSEAEIRQHARFSPPPEFMQSDVFLTDGQFDLQKYHQFLASPGVDNQLLMQLEQYYRETIPRSKLFYQVTAGLVITDEELWRMHRDMTETATVRFLSVDPRQIIPDADVQVSDAEIRTYYRANPDQFARQPRASVRYAYIPRAATQADTLAARSRAEALRGQIVGGAAFADVARRESADSVSARQGGELTIQRGQTVPEFEEAAFSLPLNQVSEPVQTQFGYHLIQVERRAGDEATVRHVLVPIELTPENEDRLFMLADSLESLGERLPLADAAAQLNLQVSTGDLIGELPFLAQVGNAIDAADWAFEDASVGEVSPVFESDMAFYIVELVARQAGGTVPLQEASADIRAYLTNQKKIERARERVREALRTGNGDPLGRVAQAFETPVSDAGPFTRGEFVPGLGRMNAAIGAAFGTRPGAVSDAVEADDMVHVVQVIAREQADRTAWEAQRDEQRQRVLPSLGEQRWEQFLASLRQQATIVDNRSEILRRGGQSPLARQ
jgi:peptidyl-prolyl cis-trans isomerase D